MRVLDFGAVLEDMLAEELAPYGAVRSVTFIHRNHSDVYRVQTERRSLIAHAATDGKAYLKRLRANLETLEILRDQRVPRLLAWRSSTAAVPGRDWAVLVYGEIPGDPISRHNFNRIAWDVIVESLARVHALDGDPEPGAGPLGRAHDPAQFAAFARTLTLRLENLPLTPSRVAGHLNAMREFVDGQAAAFRIQPRLIHGDLDRKNIVVDGEQAGLLDWADLGVGDYAFDLGMLKFMLDSVAPGQGARLIREQARRYRERFQDQTLELRLRFFLALAGLVHAFHASNDTGAFKPARAWRVRTSYLHSETQWKSPLQLDGDMTGAPAARTEQWALDIQQPFRGLYYLLAPKRVA